MGRWFYPPLDSSIITMVLEEVETYVLRRQNTVSHYITTRPILEICMAAEQRPGERVTQWWWDQSGINFGQEAVRAAEGAGGLEAEGGGGVFWRGVGG